MGQKLHTLIRVGHSGIIDAGGVGSLIVWTLPSQTIEYDEMADAPGCATLSVGGDGFIASPLRCMLLEDRVLFSEQESG